jgi:hypothetical protein
LKPPKRQRPVSAIVGANEGSETTDYLMPYGILNRGLVITPEPRQSFPWRGYRRNIEVLPTISYGGALCSCRSPCLSP